MGFFDNAGSGKEKKELQSLARQLNKDKKTFLESLHNIKSHSKCDDRISKTVPSDERSKDSLLTGVEQENENVAEGNDTQGDDVNIINKNSHCGNSRSHLCLHCFPNVNDKEAFRLFVEELFKGTEHSQVSQTNK